MKEIKTYGNFEDYQNAKDYYNTYRFAMDLYGESEESLAARAAREKAIERNKRIDSILG